jgi:hypothetical protein
MSHLSAFIKFVLSARRKNGHIMPPVSEFGGKLCGQLAADEVCPYAAKAHGIRQGHATHYMTNTHLNRCIDPENSL